MESATPSRGLFQPRQGLAPGWLSTLAAGLAIVLGTADRTPADDCHGIAEGSSGSHTTSLPCDWKNHKPDEFWYDHYFHNPGYRRDHYYHHPGTPRCVPATIIPFSVPVEAGHVDLTVYNISGQPVRHVWTGPLPAGEHRLAWDGRDAQGQPAAAGVYLYQLQVGDRRRIRKMIKLK